MAGQVTLHQASTIVDSRILPFVGDVSSRETIGTLPFTGSNAAEAGDIATVHNDTACVIKRYQQGEAEPSEGYGAAASEIVRLAMKQGEIIKVVAVS